jgi:hypothetical protein
MQRLLLIGGILGAAVLLAACGGGSPAAQARIMRLAGPCGSDAPGGSFL